MIYDCFLFNGEFECLEIRLEELKGLDVKHILVEADHTFTSKPKELHCWSDRMADLQKKYNIQLSISLYSEGISENAWDNEKKLRNRILSALKANNPNDRDVVIIADADEIVRHSVVSNYRPEHGFAALVMDKFGYYLNCLEGYQTWKSARIMPWSYLKDKTPEEVRNSGFDYEIPNSGWHFSWLGGVDKMLEKFKSFSHQEESVQKFAKKELLEYKFKTGQSMWGDNYWKFVPIDGGFPKDVVNNIEKYQQLIHV